MSYYIYKICCDDLPDFVYVGSTKSFRERKWRHKSNCHNINSREYNKKKLYNIIRENGGWDNWRMVIIEECGEISVTQARIKEEEHRLKLNANMNMLRCHRTEEEVKEQNRDRVKEWTENNKEYNKEYMKKWYENNKEKIKENNKKKYTCKCGKEIRVSGKAEHERSVVHKNYMNNLED